MVILEYRKEKHDENIKLAHQIKETVCRLVDNMMETAISEKHYEESHMYDERRGGGRMNRREGMGMEGMHEYNRGGYSSYHHPSNYSPYHTPTHEIHGEFDNRYNY